MHIGRRYSLAQTLGWSRRNLIAPLLFSTAATAAYDLGDLHWLAIPWLPVSLLGIAVAFYLGFKNNASYDRLWEARKIWGAIVNASRSWAFTARDFVSDFFADDSETTPDELRAIHTRLVLRHVAWMDALRYQLRKVKTWEHDGPDFAGYRLGPTAAPEYTEDLREQLERTLDAAEIDEALAQINPAARLLSNQSRDLAALHRRGLLDNFRHMELQKLLHELMTQQGKAERIKNFPFPRQYSTVNSFFAGAFALLVPFGMLNEFHALGDGLVWLNVVFSTLVCWVFLTADQIGDWSENPFEDLANDVPISAMARGIERDVRQMIDQTDLPPAREPIGELLM